MAWKLPAIHNWVRKRSTRGSPTVPGEGSAEAIVMFVAEAPAKTEVKLQRILIGRAGRITRKALREAGFTFVEIRDKIYFTNAVKEFIPIIGQTPSDAKVRYWAPILYAEIGAIKPKVIIALGRTAAKVLGKNADLVLPHPGSLRFNRKVYDILVETFKKVHKQYLEKK